MLSVPSDHSFPQLHALLIIKLLENFSRQDLTILSPMCLSAKITFKTCFSHFILYVRFICFFYTNKFRFSLLYHLFICHSPFGKLFVPRLDISMPSACWNPEIKLHFPPAYSHLVHPVLCLEHYTGKGLLIMNLPRRIQMGSRERDCLCSEFQKAGEKVLFGFSL